MKLGFYFTVFFAALFFWTANAYPQEVGPEKVIKPIGFDVSPKLSDIPAIPPAYVDRSWKEKVIPNKEGFLEEFNAESTWTGPDPVWQSEVSGNR